MSNNITIYLSMNLL